MSSIQNISIIGSGNTATFFAKKLVESGFKIIQIIGRNETTAKSLAQLINACYSKEYIIENNVDLVLICVSDHQIESCVKAIADSCPAIVCHCAGSVDLAILNKFERHGVVYPLQTLSHSTIINELEVPFLIEANSNDSLDSLNELIVKLGYNPTVVSSLIRLKYHLSAVFANNFTNALLMAVEELSNKDQLNFDLFRPLIKRTIDKIDGLSPTMAQTGPAKRADLSTINLHLELLKNEPQLLAVYKAITAFIQSKY